MVCVCAHVHTYAVTCEWRSEDRLQESVFSFLGIGFMPLDTVAATFIYRVILPDLSQSNCKCTVRLIAYTTLFSGP